MTDEGKPGDAELSPEDYFGEGFQTGEELAREELAEQLEDAGFDPDEIDDVVFGDDDDDYEDEGVYDPAPRRKGRRRGRSRKGKSKGRRRSRMSYVRHPAMVFDPAPRRRYGRRRRMYDPAPKRSITARRTGKKGLLTGLKKLVFPGVTVGSFLALYTKRAQEIGKANAFEAIMYDLQHIDINKSIDKLQADAGGILMPAAVGIGAQYIKKHVGKIRGANTALDMLGNAALGYATGKFFFDLVDPPIEKSGNNGIRVISSSATETMTEKEQVASTVYRNPFGV